MTLTLSTLGAPVMSTMVEAVLPATFTVIVFALVEVMVESIALAESVSMPSPVRLRPVTNSLTDSLPVRVQSMAPKGLKDSNC